MSNLEINEYSVRFNKTYGVKLAIVAVLHERPFDDILEDLSTIKPSLILLHGDTLERHDEGYMGIRINNPKEICIINI